MNGAGAMHGGDVDAVSREFGIPIADLIDFSANINPAGPPPTVLARLAHDASDPALLTRYPDPTYAEVRAALARHLAVPAECVTVANGSTALFSAVIRTCAPAACVLAVPAFAEQLRALAGSRCAILPFALRASDNFLANIEALSQILETCGPALCLLTNPHNPSGALVARSDMGRIIRTAERTGTRLVIDEAFIDYAPSASVAGDVVRSSHLVVLRSLTKFYGMPGLRVGYAVSAPDMAESIDLQLPRWPVTTLAARAAAAALEDQGYARETLRVVAVERAWMSDRLAASGLPTYPSAANFLLVRLSEDGPNSTELRAELIRNDGLIVRDCRSFGGMEEGRFIRVAVLTRSQNLRLLQALGRAVGRAHAHSV